MQNNTEQRENLDVSMSKSATQDMLERRENVGKKVLYTNERFSVGGFLYSNEKNQVEA